MPRKKPRTVTVRMTEERYARLCRSAEERGVTASKRAEQIFDNYRDIETRMMTLKIYLEMIIRSDVDTKDEFDKIRAITEQEVMKQSNFL